METAVWERRKCVRQNSRYLFARMATSEGYFYGGSRIHYIVLAKDKSFQFWPSRCIKFPCVDYVIRLRFGLRETGAVVVNGLEVFRMVVIDSRYYEGMGLV